MRINIKIVLEIGICVPKWMILFSAKVRNVTTKMMQAMMISSRLRLLRSSIGVETDLTLFSILVLRI
jgi:hypothetical protein